MTEVILKPGHVKPIWAGHPWVFPQGLQKKGPAPEHGSEVLVRDAQGNPMGRGFFSAKSAIAVRLFTRDVDEEFSLELVQARLRKAIRLRAALGLPSTGERATNSYRLFHGEGDRLPGLVVDRYGDVLVVQFGTAGMEQQRETILNALEAELKPRAILERTTAKAAKSEGFEVRSGVVRGEEVRSLSATERGLVFELPESLSQKTGYYFDQRPLRARVEELSKGRSVLDAYSYVGPIGLSARRGGATRVLCVDSSQPALTVLESVAAKNGLEVEAQKANAVQFLAEQSAEWDLVVADPPKLAQSRAGREKAARAFRRVAAGAVGATREGGIVVLCSCSAALGIDSVERALALGARDAGRQVSVVERLFQGADHPCPPAFREGLYLSTAIAVVE